MKPEDLFAIGLRGELVFDPVRPYLYFTDTRADKGENRTQSRLGRLRVDTLTVDFITSGPDDSRPTPSPDGQHLAFLSSRSGSRQVWVLPLSGGEPWQMSAIEGGVKDLCWAPNSQGLVVVAHIAHGLLEHEQAASKAPGHAASDQQREQYFNRDVRHITHQYYKLDGSGYFDDGRDQLVWVSLDRSMRLLTSGFHHYAQPQFSPEGSVLYYLRRAYDPESGHPAQTDIEQLDWATGTVATLPLGGLAVSTLAVSADHRYLAFQATRLEDQGYGLTRLYVWDLKDDQLRDWSGHLDRSVGDESTSDMPALSTARPAWQGQSVITLLSDAARVIPVRLTAEGVERLWDRQCVVYDFALGGDVMALAVSDPVHPSGIVLVHRDGREQTFWANTPWPAEHGPVMPRETWAVQADGTRVHTWAIVPDGPGPCPGVLEIHGGPMSMYGYRYMHEFQCLASQGYAVIYTNPRGSQGYGAQFCQTIMGQWGEKDYRDVMAGLEQALTVWPDIDGTKLGVAGGSYGGFMVNWIVSHTDRFMAGVTMRSVVNRFSAMGSSDLGWLRVPQYGDRPWWDDPAPYWEQSPLKYASAIHTPLLIEHQEHDFRLPIEQGEQLYAALKYLGRPVEMIMYPNESHGMSRTGKPWHRVYRLRSIIRWFNRYLGDGNASV
ncbi:MAG: S9 family peptidase [Sulfobacillus acidophilus]|uniref:S9 family peptidase n=1 Tax=Sulfobacillus acidophilus TaxID=53633 RepID=A0A2T2WP89_9FIRM|nr:MAG: S9 family peptidase [Sulfobacillus acidophilus]